MGATASHTTSVVVVVSEAQRTLGAAASLGPRFEIRSFRSASQARRALHESDVAIIDLEENGFALGRDIRDSSWGRDIPIVMLCDRPHDVWLCRQAGADEVLVKPLKDTSELAEALERARGAP